jgi:phage terminase large subunit-like protein
MALANSNEIRSLAQRLAESGEWETMLSKLSDEEAAKLVFDWTFWGRPCQFEPGGEWDHWFFLGGRGTGKTRAGAEWVRSNVDARRAHRIALVAPTSGDGRDVIVEGESGIMSVFPHHERPEYEPSKRRITFHTGAVATLYSADEPDRLRGPQHDLAWAEETAAWKKGEEALDNLLLGLRLGPHPRLLITTTPKPLPWLRALAEQSNTVMTKGSTYDNIAHLAPSFIAAVIDRYEGTSLGRQELQGEWLESVEGALWTMETIESHRWPIYEDKRDWRTIVGVDPPGEVTAEAGIIVAAGPRMVTRGAECAVLADVSVRGRPEQWGKRAVEAFKQFGAEKIVVEANQGGDMVRAVIQSIDPDVPVQKVRASKSKGERAEPVAAKYELGRVHHVGYFPQLESQMVSWTRGDKISPDRMDALVHAVSELLPEQARAASVESVAGKRLSIGGMGYRRRFGQGR